MGKIKINNSTENHFEKDEKKKKIIVNKIMEYEERERENECKPAAFALHPSKNYAISFFGQTNERTKWIERFINKCKKQCAKDRDPPLVGISL